MSATRSTGHETLNIGNSTSLRHPCHTKPTSPGAGQRSRAHSRTLKRPEDQANRELSAKSKSQRTERNTSAAIGIGKPGSSRGALGTMMSGILNRRPFWHLSKCASCIRHWAAGFVRWICRQTIESQAAGSRMGSSAISRGSSGFLPNIGLRAGGRQMFRAGAVQPRRGIGRCPLSRSS